MASLQQLDPDQYGELLWVWLRSNCNSTCTKEIARHLKYRYFCFTPKRKLKILGELIFLNISLIIYAVNIASDNEDDASSVIDSFLEKMRERILNPLAVGDDSFKERYSSRMKEYSNILPRADSALALSNGFLRNLYGSASASLEFEKNIYMAITIGCSQKALLGMLDGILLVEDDA